MRVFVPAWTFRACLLAGLLAATSWCAAQGLPGEAGDDQSPPVPVPAEDEVGQGVPSLPGRLLSQAGRGPGLPEDAPFPPLSPEARGDLANEYNGPNARYYPSSGYYANSGNYADYEPEELPEQTYFFPQYWPIRMRGWLDGGYMGNTRSPASRFNGPYNAVDRNEIMGNQAYLIAEAGAIPTDGCFGWGARIDALYGEDFFLAQSTGMERRTDATPKWNSEFYGVAVPQAYGEFGNKTVNMKVGHFYSIVGYEGVQSVGNFFYSHAYSYQFAGPFTHWGGLATWNVTERLSLQGGVTNGWDALDRPTDQMGYLAGAKYQHESFWTSFAITTGQEFNNLAGNAGVANGFTNRTRYSYLLGLYLTEKLEYVFHQWYGFQQNGAIGGGNADWWGVDQYLYYKINSKWKAGFRGEWFYDQDGTRLGLNRVTNPNKPPFAGSIYSVSLGLNYSPHENFMLRPEIRADFYDPKFGGLPFQDGTKANQIMIGLDGIVKF